MAAREDKLGLVHDLPPRSDFPLISKVTSVSNLRAAPRAA